MPKRKPAKLPVVPPWPEIEQILRGTKTERDRLLLMVCAFMGLRAFEAVKLNVEDVDLRQKTLFIHEGKGGRDAVLPLPVFLARALRGWIGSRKSGPLFYSRKGKTHLTPDGLRDIVKRAAIAAGLPEATKGRKYSPHRLRAAFCTEKIRRGVPLPYVQRLMRHARIATTLLYTAVTPEDLREGMEA